jgi:peroxiredoxin
MAATPSTMLALGTAAPDFTLTDTVSSRPITLSVHRAGRPALVMFICNHCPFVKHIRAQLAAFGREYGPRDVCIVAISSNDPLKYPDDDPEHMAAEAAQAGYTFPYVFDATQQVAHAYRAACTPDFFLFNRAGQLVYRGQLDDSRPSNTLPVTGRDLRAAVDAVLAGRDPSPDQRPSIGCNIKWKPGNEPDYAR